MSIPDHPYRPLIEEVAAAYSPLDPDVLEAMVWVESNFNPKARSASDARGLTQIIYRWHQKLVDETAIQLNVPAGPDALYLPVVALYAGGRLLRWLYVDDDESKRSWERAVRRYFSGSYDPPPGFVDGQGTSAEQHIAKFRTAIAAVKQYRSSVPVPSPSQPTEGNDMALNFDPSLTPFPPYEERFALAKRDGHGQDNFGTRTLRGNVWHRGLTKKQTLDQAVSYLIAASTAGLTDGYIDNKTGRLVMMNPMKTLFSLPAWWEDRAGWANGVYGKGRAPSEDARAFVARFGGQIGANIINQDLESYELLGEYEDPISEAAKQTMVAIAANRAQRMKIPYNVWPLNPATGTVVHFGHREFTLKECPGEVVWDFINGEMVTRVREVLRKAQTGSASAPIPAPQPAPSPVPTPVPVEALDIMADLFGKIDGYGYDPQGVVTKYWLTEGAKTGEYPALVKVRKDGPIRSFIFSNGMVLQNEIGTGKIWRMTHATELAAVLVDVLAG